MSAQNVPAVDPARVARYAEAALVDLDNEHAFCAHHSAVGSRWYCACGVQFADRHGHADHVRLVQAAAVVAVADEEHAALVEAQVAKVEALADEWTAVSQREQEFADRHQGYYLGVVGTRRNCRDHLLAALADAPAEQPIPEHVWHAWHGDAPAEQRAEVCAGDEDSATCSVHGGLWILHDCCSKRPKAGA